VLDVFTHVAGFGQGGSVCHDERNIKHARQGLREQRLARASRPDEQDVALAQFDVVILDIAVTNALVVVIDCDGQSALGLVLTNDISVKEFLDFRRRRQFIADGVPSGFLGFFQNDVIAKVDALIADEHRRPGDKLAYFVLILSAERAVQGLIVARTFFFGHRNFRSICTTPIYGDVKVAPDLAKSARPGGEKRLPGSWPSALASAFSPGHYGRPEPCQ